MDTSRAAWNLLEKRKPGGLSGSPPSANNPIASALTLAINLCLGQHWGLKLPRSAEGI